MPNYVTTRIVFRTAEDCREAQRLMSGRDRNGDESDCTFNALIPMPDDVYRGEIPCGAKQGTQEDWYHWSVEHWNTKWDACAHEWTARTLTMDTAWNCPFAVIAELSRRLGHPVTVRYADECIDYNSGMFVMRDGKMEYERELTDRQRADLIGATC